MSFEQTLTSWDYEVVDIVSTGKDALEKAAYLRPDLILMDIVLKGEMDGIEAAAQIKDKLDIPVIYLTAHPEESAVKRAKRTAPYGYLIKPVNKTDLKNSIELALYKHRLESRLKESETRYRSIFENSMLAFLLTAPNGDILDANPAAENLFGYSRDEICKLGRNDLVDLNDDRLPELLKERKSAGEAYGLLNFFKKDGSKFTAEISSSIFQDSEGNERTSMAIRDISERKKAAQDLLEREKKYRTLFNSSPDYIVLVGADGKLMDVNESAQKLTGLSQQDLIDKHIKDIGIFPEEDLSLHLENMSKIMAGKEVKPHESRFIDKNNEIRYCKDYLNPLKIDDEIVAYQVICHDITEHKKAEETLKESEERYRSILDNLQDAYIRADKEGRIILVSPSTPAMYKFDSPKDMMGIPAVSLYKYAEDRQEMLKELEERGRVDNMEGEGLRKDGTSFWVSMNAQYYYDGQGRIIGTEGFLRDIDESKRLEEALKESETLYKTLFENTGTATLITEEDKTISLVNAEIENLVGYSKEELEGKKKWVDFVVPAEQERMENYHQQRRDDPSTAPKYYDFHLVDRYGNVKDCHMVIDLLPGTKKSIASILDVTELKNTEARLRNSLKEKDLLIKEIHHRVKNNLQIISSLLDLQEEFVKEDPTAVNVLKESQNRVWSMAVIHEMLYQSRDLSHINFKHYIQNLISQLYVSHGVDVNRIKLVLKIEGTFFNIETAIPLGLIVSELISNSLKYAFPSGNSGEIKVDLHSKNKEFALIISDDGIGISKTVQIGETKTLGLRLVNNLVKQLDGNIELERSNGTQFTIKFNELEYEKRYIDSSIKSK